MYALSDIHAGPPAPVPDGSLVGWVWLILVLALLVACGLVLASRR